MEETNLKFVIVFITVLILQSCMMSIVHPVRRINTSTFIDDARFELATAGVVTHAFEIDEQGGYISTMSSLADFEMSYRFDKNFKILADYSLMGRNSSNYSGYLFMSGFEKSFEITDKVYFALTSQAQLSSVNDTSKLEDGTHRVTIDSNIKALNLINEIVYQPDMRFVIRTGLYYDRVWNETRIFSSESKKIKFWDEVIGIPFKASARFKYFELFGGFMHFESLKTGKDDPDSNSYFLGLKYSFGERQ